MIKVTAYDILCEDTAGALAYEMQLKLDEEWQPFCGPYAVSYIGKDGKLEIRYYQAIVKLEWAATKSI